MSVYLRTGCPVPAAAAQPRHLVFCNGFAVDDGVATAGAAAWPWRAWLQVIYKAGILFLLAELAARLAAARLRHVLVLQRPRVLHAHAGRHSADSSDGRVPLG